MIITYANRQPIKEIREEDKYLRWPHQPEIATRHLLLKFFPTNSIVNTLERQTNIVWHTTLWMCI